MRQTSSSYRFEESLDRFRGRLPSKVIFVGPPPVLNEPKSLSGMNLDFTGGAKLGEVFLNLSKQSGVSIILHASASGH